MNILYRIANFGFRLIRPNFWFQNVPSCPHLDDFINKCLDENDIVIEDSFHVVMGGKRIWVRNFPYQFGEDESRNVIPFPLTRVRLNNTIAKTSLLKGNSYVHIRNI